MTAAVKCVKGKRNGMQGGQEEREFFFYHAVAGCCIRNSAKEWVGKAKCMAF